jgi:hypothetical protein
MSDQDRTIPERLGEHYPVGEYVQRCGTCGYDQPWPCNAARAATIPERPSTPHERRNRLDELAIAYALEHARDDEDDDEQQLGMRTW